MSQECPQTPEGWLKPGTCCSRRERHTLDDHSSLVTFRWATVVSIQLWPLDELVNVRTRIRRRVGGYGVRKQLTIVSAFVLVVALAISGAVMLLMLHRENTAQMYRCLLYTSDAADE